MPLVRSRRRRHDSSLWKPGRRPSLEPRSVRSKFWSATRWERRKEDPMVWERRLGVLDGDGRELGELWANRHVSQHLLFNIHR